MNIFKKVDLTIQILLLAFCWLPIIIYQSFMMTFFWMYTMPLLGLWQLVSVGVHAYQKQLSKWHKIYLKALVGVLLFSIIQVVLVEIASSYQADFILLSGILLGFGMSLFYIFVSYKTLKVKL
jgi:hypothetical protein